MDKPTETWKPVVGYEGVYEVSDRGQVRRVAAKRGATVGRVQKPRLRGMGKYKYQVSALYDLAGVRKDFSTHRLVAEAFLGAPPDGYVVNHKDGDSLNNHVDNLEWVSFRDNIRHAWDTGLQKRGEGHPKSKLTTEQVREIRRLRGRVTQRDLAERFGVAKGVIQSIQERRIWTHI